MFKNWYNSTIIHFSSVSIFHNNMPTWTKSINKGAYRNSCALDVRVGRWTLDSGHWTLDPGRWTLGSGPWMLHLGHDRFRVDIYSAHVLISITFAVFEYLDTALATENKILTFLRAVLPYKIGSSNVNLALILFFCGHTSYKRVSWKKKGVATRSIPRLKRAWLNSWVMNSYVLSQISKTPVVRSTQFFQNSKKNGSSW